MKTICFVIAICLATFVYAQPEVDRMLDYKLEQSVTLDFADTPANEFFQFLRVVSNLNIVLTPQYLMNASHITLKATDLRLKDCIQQALFLTHGSSMHFHGVVLVGTPKEIQEFKLQKWPEDPEHSIEQKLLEQRVSLDFSDTPLTDFVDYFASRAGINIVLHPVFFQQQVLVNIQVQDVSMLTVLRIVCLLNGNATYCYEPGVLKIIPKIFKN